MKSGSVEDVLNLTLTPQAQEILFPTRKKTGLCDGVARDTTATATATTNSAAATATHTNLSLLYDDDPLSGDVKLGYVFFRDNFQIEEDGLMGTNKLLHGPLCFDALECLEFFDGSSSHSD